MIEHMGFFGTTNEPHVSKREFHDLRSRLFSKGFTEEELDRVTMIFRADLNEPEETQAGIDSGEIERGIAWMRFHEHIHHISTKKIALLAEEIKKAL